MLSKEWTPIGHPLNTSSQEGLYMAIKATDYKQVSQRGKEIAFLKRHIKDNSKFLFDFRKDGKRFRKTFISDVDTPSNMIDYAKKALEIEIQKAGNLRPSIDQNINTSDFYTHYVESKKSNWSDKYHKILNGIFEKRIEPNIGKKRIKDIKPIDITTILAKAYKIDRKGKHVLDEKGKKIPSSNRIKKGILDLLVQMFKQAIEDELIEKSPVKSSHSISRIKREEKRIILDAEKKYRLVHQAIHKCFKDNPKVRALMLFGFYGRRRSEVLSLKWDDIGDDTYIIRGENSKVKTDMTFTLPEDVIAALTQIERDSEFIFSSNRNPKIPMNNVFDFSKKIIEETGIKEFNFHWMRNLSVSALSAMGVEAIHLSAMLGHTDTNTIRQYLELQREASSKQAIEASSKLLTSVNNA